jgi:hypothetical protein
VACHRQAEGAGAGREILGERCAEVDGVRISRASGGSLGFRFWGDGTGRGGFRLRRLLHENFLRVTTQLGEVAALCCFKREPFDVGDGAGSARFFGLRSRFPLRQGEAGEERSPLLVKSGVRGVGGRQSGELRDHLVAELDEIQPRFRERLHAGRERIDGEARCVVNLLAERRQRRFQRRVATELLGLLRELLDAPPVLQNGRRSALGGGVVDLTLEGLERAILVDWQLVDEHGTGPLQIDVAIDRVGVGHFNQQPHDVDAGGVAAARLVLCARFVHLKPL